PAQRRQLDLLQAMNRAHAEDRGRDEQLEARIASLEMAYRMQGEAQEAFDIGRETPATRNLYGAGEFAHACLIARRLPERGFSMWLAGGGVKGGTVYGATDEFGFRAVENRLHNHDLHATILHLMGLDHEKLTYRYSGRDFRLTDVSGKVAREIMA